MAALRKFLFDNSFDEALPDLAGEAANEEVSEDIVEEVVEEAPPTFTEADLKAAHDKAFAAGQEEGLRAAGDTIEQRCNAALATINEHLGQLFSKQATASERAAEDATEVAVAITRKILPALAERGAVEEVEQLIIESMTLIRDQPRVVIHVHESLRDILAERIEATALRHGYEGQVILSVGADMDIVDCRIEWTSGGAVRDTEDLWCEIDAIISRNLGSKDETPTDTAEPHADGAPESESETGVSDAEKIESTPESADAEPHTDGKNEPS